MLYIKYVRFLWLWFGLIIYSLCYVVFHKANMHAICLFYHLGISCLYVSFYGNHKWGCHRVGLCLPFTDNVKGHL